MLNNPIMLEQMIVACFLVILNWLIIEETAVSIILIPDVIAAKNNKIKNKLAKIFENGNCENISGKEINTRVAPAVGSTPNENTIGKIIIPAVIAINVSQIIRVYAELTILVSSFIFEFTNLPFSSKGSFACAIIYLSSSVFSFLVL